MVKRNSSNSDCPFRIWFPSENRMLYSGMLTFDMSDGAWRWEGRNGSFHSRYEGVILMKGTGILINDKDSPDNYRQLYSADLFKIKGGDSTVIEIMVDTTTGNFDWKRVDDQNKGIHADWDWNELCYDHRDRIVYLGNRYQNPELLNN